MRLSELKVRATSDRAYFSDQPGRDGEDEVVQRLQKASLSLNPRPPMYPAGAAVWEGERASRGARQQTSTSVSSLCRSVVSIASEPADIEVSEDAPRLAISICRTACLATEPHPSAHPALPSTAVPPALMHPES